MSGPLAGVRVLDLTRLLPGAFATGLLGDLGAEVIKVEQPGGDPMRAYSPRLTGTSAYSWVTDRNKRSVEVDLRDPEGLAGLLRLASGAQIAMEGFRPGVADRLGVGYEALRERNQALVYCSLTGYGPESQEAGHDINYIGRAGLLAGGALPSVQIADLAGGSLLGLVGVLAALVHAQRTGEGDHVEVSMTAGAFALQALALGEQFAGRPATGLLSGTAPCYGIYTCADGRQLTVGALEPPFWRALCEGVQRPDLVSTQFDGTALDTWRALFAQRSRDDWLERFKGRDACVGPVNDLAEAMVALPEMITELDGHPQLATPIRLRRHAPSVRTRAPTLGADNCLLTEAGRSDPHPS